MEPWVTHLLLDVSLSALQYIVFFASWLHWTFLENSVGKEVYSDTKSKYLVHDWQLWLQHLTFVPTAWSVRFYKSRIRVEYRTLYRWSFIYDRLKNFQCYNGVKILSIWWKLYFIFWILHFSMLAICSKTTKQPNKLLQCWAVAATSPSLPHNTSMLQFELLS